MSKTSKAKTLSVRVKQDANTDAVKYNGTLITKKQFVKVDEGVTKHRGYDFLEIKED